MKLKIPIVERIRDGANAYFKQHGQRPDRVYLGVQEWIDMSELANYFGINCNPAMMVSGPRATFCGMAVYEVNAESYLQFGRALPSPCG